MHLARRRGARTAIVALVMLPLLLPGAAPARAAVGATLECTATGTVEVEGDPTFPRFPQTRWFFSGVGSCTGDGEGPWAVELSGHGWSSSWALGLCSLRPTLNDWGMSMTLDLDSHQPGVPSLTRDQRWRAPERFTTFPVTTPFKIIESEDPVGAGTFFTKLFVDCAASSNRTDDPWAATFAWTMLA